MSATSTMAFSMDPQSSVAALLAFAGITYLHILVILCGERMPETLTGRRRADMFQPSSTYMNDFFIGRVARSHANCLENLPLFTVVVVSNSLYVGAPDIGVLSWYYVYARALQALIHWTAVNETMVMARFTCFGASLLLLTVMALRTAGILE